MFKLIKLTAEMEYEFLGFFEECSSEEIIPAAIDPIDKSYKEFLESLSLSEYKETIPAHLVPATLYFLTDESGTLLGAIHFRHYLNDYLLKFGGHIGYGIRPSQRRKGYATEQLKLMLPIAKASGLDKVLITCDKSNFASAKTIIACGGILEDEQPNGDKITQRYWIAL